MVEPTDTVFVLVNLNGGGLAQWGEDDTTPTGPIAFANADDAERFKSSMPAVGNLQVMPVTMDEILLRAAAHNWTQLWTVSLDKGGNPTWYAHPLPSA
jgi:hypothetical protein